MEKKPKLSDMFVANPIKTEAVADIVIEGSFQCQQCDEVSYEANMREGKIFWTCAQCGYVSKVGGLG